MKARNYKVKNIQRYKKHEPQHSCILHKCNKQKKNKNKNKKKRK